MQDWKPVGGAVGLRCLRCGADDLQVTRPGWVRGLRDWLRFGGRWRPSTRECRRCGHVAVDGSETYLIQRPGWWWAPLHLARALRRRRSRIPVPATYAMAAAGGAVLGICAQLVLGWPWWLVAGGVVVAVWLGFLSTAFWGRGPSWSLGTEVLMAVDPVRALEREHDAMLERFRAAAFPLYGLPAAWSGPRHLGGSGHRGDARGRGMVVTSLSLAHGDPTSGQGPQLRVEVRVEQEEVAAGGPAERRRWLAEDLAWSVAVEAGLAPGRHRDPAWSEVAIPVDGRPVGFKLLAEGRHWVAHGELEGRLLVLDARDLAVEDVRLVRVTDVEPYVEGTRRLEAEAQERYRNRRSGRRHPDHHP